MQKSVRNISTGSRYLLETSLITLCVLAAAPSHAGQEVAEIPFFNAPPGTAALGGGVRLGQSIYRAFDNDDQRQYDLIPLYLYNGKYLFARGTAGGVHFVNRDNIQLNLLFQFRFNKLDPDRNAFYEGIETRRQPKKEGSIVITLSVIRSRYISKGQTPLFPR